MLGEFNRVPLTNTYKISTIINHNFPETLPYVFEDSKLIPSGFNHFMLNGSLCLGVEADIRERLASCPTILYFFQELVNQFFYSVRYYEFYHCFPFGEWAHGLDGIIDFYKRKFNVQTELEVKKLLNALENTKSIQKNAECPCGSGMRFFECHGSQLLEMYDSNLIRFYRRDSLKLKE